MAKMTSTLAKGGRKVYEKVETKVLVAAGRKAVRDKARTVGKVSRKAAKAGLIAGAFTAAAVVAREVRKRREA
jgi:hypothetical protein